ncbi:MAG: phosphate ABC transporter permease PstA [Spirochaetes bacterium]|uniref:Phosphate transport system permease protein PstA n=1 Tax=Candidatus Gallitreponema excrementavium TaxID=2840840 RepID=A0A9D9N2X4_9SPIR|nr:phosphate ABC transporter permease PstA [Candidatus Gallitreponema excrementavium]
MKRWDIAFRRKITAWCLRFPVYFSAFFTGFVAVLITSYILVRGIPNLKPELFSLVYNSENVSLLAPLVNSFLSALLALLIAVPAGVFSAVYLVEYSKKGSKLVKIVRLTSETLSGIPSIVYGLFGMLFFVTTLGLGMSLLSGVFTLAIMVLPLIMRTTEEALLAVPDSYREGSFGLGAGRLGTVIKIVLPAAVPGILSGVILAAGRIIGETAALIYTAGTVPQFAFNPELSARTLAVHLYVLSGEGQHMNESYAVAVVLLALVLVINTISYAVARKIRGGQGE